MLGLRDAKPDKLRFQDCNLIWANPYHYELFLQNYPVFKKAQRIHHYPGSR